MQKFLRPLRNPSDRISVREEGFETKLQLEKNKAEYFKKLMEKDEKHKTEMDAIKEKMKEQEKEIERLRRRDDLMKNDCKNFKKDKNRYKSENEQLKLEV